MANPSPESLAAAERILHEARRWPVDLDMEGFDNTQQAVATLIDAAYAERLERLERIAEAAAAYRDVAESVNWKAWREAESRLFAALDAKEGGNGTAR